MATRRRKTKGRRPVRRGGFPEHLEQVQLVARFRLAYPALAKLLFAIPNGGKRGKAEAARLKAEGVTAGVPDLMLAVVTDDYPGLYIEMKRPDGLGKVSKDQRELIDLLRQQGYRVEVCHGAKEAWDVVTVYLADYGKETTRQKTRESPLLD